MVSQEALEKLSKHKDPLLQECYSALEKIIISPYLDTYLTIYNQVQDFNEQLKINGEEKTIVSEDGVETHSAVVGRVDLFGDKDEKEFDRVWKYMTGAPELLMSLEKLRNLMLPADQKKVSDLKKSQKVSGVAA